MSQMLYQTQPLANNTQIKMDNSLLNSKANYMSSSLYNQYHAPPQDNFFESKSVKSNLEVSENKNDIELNMMYVNFF